MCLLSPFLFAELQGNGQLEGALARCGTQPWVTGNESVNQLFSGLSPLLPHLCKACLERILSLSAHSLCGGGQRSVRLLAQSAHLNFPSSEVLPQKADRDQYELLCPDNTRRPVEEYEQCHLARVPSHVVVARSVDGKEDLIQELLRVAQVHPPSILSPTYSSILQCV